MSTKYLRNASGVVIEVLDTDTLFEVVLNGGNPAPRYQTLGFVEADANDLDVAAETAAATTAETVVETLRTLEGEFEIAKQALEAEKAKVLELTQKLQGAETQIHDLGSQVEQARGQGRESAAAAAAAKSQSEAAAAEVADIKVETDVTFSRLKEENANLAAELEKVKGELAAVSKKK